MEMRNFKTRQRGIFVEKHGNFYPSLTFRVVKAHEINTPSRHRLRKGRASLHNGQLVPILAGIAVVSSLR
jgi:hypothetical protein